MNKLSRVAVKSRDTDYDFNVYSIGLEKITDLCYNIVNISIWRKNYDK